MLDGADERAHGDGEDGWQNAAQDNRRPPDDGEGCVSLGEDGKELPFLAIRERGHGSYDISVTRGVEGASPAALLLPYHGGHREREDTECNCCRIALRASASSSV